MKGGKMQIGAQLKAIMDKENISGYRVSKETGINASLISKIIHDKAMPTTTTLQRILDVLGYEVRFVKPKKGKQV
jgi:transcriptional regulator with XRE-family HTH domain